jgi:hypothetical protein
MEALSPGRWRGQRALNLGRGGLDTSRCPRPVLGQGVAEPVWSPVRFQGRGRGSTRPPDAIMAAAAGAGARVHAQAQEQGAAPMGSGAFEAATCPLVPRLVGRLLPEGSSEATGARAAP